MGKSRRRFKQEIFLDIIHTMNQFRKVRLVMMHTALEDHDSLQIDIIVNPDDMHDIVFLENLDIATTQIKKKFSDVNFIFKPQTTGLKWPRMSVCMFGNSFSDYRK